MSLEKIAVIYLFIVLTLLLSKAKFCWNINNSQQVMITRKQRLLRQDQKKINLSSDHDKITK